ncbi:MAG: PAS domain S-box protein [Ideonella sp.]|nr:PAS domain S-box protein [Ideonella sp.]
MRLIGDAVITTDADGRIESANPVAESLIGNSEAEVLGRAGWRFRADARFKRRRRARGPGFTQH